VTGATGFIAAHIVKTLLERGYRVRGTVRNTDPDRVKFLTDLPGAKERLELFKADLLGPEGTFDEAVKDCDYVLHTASPFVIAPKDPKRDLADPALKGTLSVLGSCVKHQKTIKRVVLTSSIVALTDEPGATYNFTEKDWNTSSSLKRNPYMYSKVLAEKAAWDFMAEKKPSFSLVTILPGVVLGPSLSSSMSESVEVTVYGIIQGKFPGVCDFAWSFVDVRDVALSHIIAFENEKASGRYICSNQTLHFRDVVAIIKETNPKLPYPKNDMSGPFFSAMMSGLIANFFPSGERDFIKTHIKSFPKYDSTKIRNELKIDFKPAKESVVDTIDDLLRWKHLEVK